MSAVAGEARRSAADPAGAGRARCRTALRSSTSPVRLNVNENPYPPSEQVVAEIAAAAPPRPGR